jgi:hypothetical protein
MKQRVSPPVLWKWYASSTVIYGQFQSWRMRNKIKARSLHNVAFFARSAASYLEM